MTLKIPDTPISCVSMCVCARGCMYRHLCVCGIIFMKHALPSHTVGVSRSSSLAINHCRQLISAQSACERTALHVLACVHLTVAVRLQQSSQIPPWLLNELDVASAADTYLTRSMNASLLLAFVPQLQLLSLSAH